MIATILREAEQFVAERTRVFADAIDADLAAARADIPAADLRRFDTSIDAMLGRRRLYESECAGLRFAFLPADEYFPRRHFPWFPEFEAATPVIQAELASLLETGDEGFAPYVAMPPGAPPNKWTELDGSDRWSAYYLWKYGAPIDAAVRRCPQTAALLEAMPRAQIPGRCPSAFFSVLRPHSRIPPHTGVSNTRAVVHLPLIVPDGCGFRVGGETRQWRVGEAFAFDDTIKHEAWNDSDHPRVVLIIDVWNPHLTIAEQRLVQTFYTAADRSGQKSRTPTPRHPVTPTRAQSVAAIARDANWLAHRYDPANDTVHFRQVPRAAHDRATFLTDEYLGAADPLVLGREEVLAAAPPHAPVHFIFHSAYCCSTLLARALDLPGTAMGLKEPVILNDIVGWRHRGGPPARVERVLGDALTLLARPFAPGEATVIKPSNLLNEFAAAMLVARPQSRAVMMYAPLRVFLGSVARKGMWGRLWVRDLMVKQLEGGLIDLGFSDAEYLRHTDLQAAAVGWLAQHALFQRLAARFGPKRVRVLESEVLVAEPRATVARVAALFGIALDAAALDAVVAGPAFARDAKTGDAFAPGRRDAEQRLANEVHGEEIDKVSIWADAVAQSAGVAIPTDAHL